MLFVFDDQFVKHIYSVNLCEYIINYTDQNFNSDLSVDMFASPSK